MFVAPVIDRGKAEELLSRREGIIPARRKIIKTELVYLPLYLFTVKLEDKKGNELHDMVSVDGIKGEFAFFRESEYADTPAGTDFHSPFVIGESLARETAVREYQRILHTRNMRKSNTVRVLSFSEGKMVFYPYWIGYYRRRGGYDFEVADAVSGGKQGVRMKPVFIDLLLQAKKSKPQD